MFTHFVQSNFYKLGDPKVAFFVQNLFLKIWTLPGFLCICSLCDSILKQNSRETRITTGIEHNHCCILPLVTPQFVFISLCSPRTNWWAKNGTHSPDHSCSLLDINTEPRNEINFNVHKYRLVESRLYALVTVTQHSKSYVVLQPATRIPLQTNHTETPTHIEPRTIRPMW